MDTRKPATWREIVYGHAHAAMIRARCMGGDAEKQGIFQFNMAALALYNEITAIEPSKV